MVTGGVVNVGIEVESEFEDEVETSSKEEEGIVSVDLITLAVVDVVGFTVLDVIFPTNIITKIIEKITNKTI